jgi:hypothetical protein
MLGRRTTLGGALAAVVCGAARAQGLAWTRLGSRDVLLSNDRDRIVAGTTQSTFTAIRLEVRGSAVFFEDLDVTFGNGQRQDIRVRALIPEGGSTRVLDLAGGARTIRHVDLRYRRVFGAGRATVTLFGRLG